MSEKNEFLRNLREAGKRIENVIDLFTGKKRTELGRKAYQLLGDLTVIGLYDTLPKAFDYDKIPARDAVKESSYQRIYGPRSETCSVVLGSVFEWRTLDEISSRTGYEKDYVSEILRSLIDDDLVEVKVGRENVVYRVKFKKD
jgi:hypothetical protein